MKTVSVAKLKASLSEYLAKVKAGEEVLVIMRGKPIGKIVPLKRSEELLDAQLLELEKAGIARIGTGKLPSNFWKLSRPKDPHDTILSGLLEDRNKSL